jgi:hypothetical protein
MMRGALIHTMHQDIIALRELQSLHVRVGSFSSDRPARDVAAMSAFHPITTELVRHNEPALRATSRLMHRSKKQSADEQISAKA